MKIVLGPYHPQLEDALAEEIRARREQDLLAPLLLVVPSETLRRRVKVLLSGERGLHLLNFHVLTFFQLSLNLFHEMDGPAEPTLRDDTFMEEALKRVIPAGGRFARMMENDAYSALWQSLRDLKDAMVDPEAALEALREGLFRNTDRNALGDLFALHREVTRRFPEWQAQDHQDLDAAVARHAPVSAHLGQFERIYYYGFYDLTQSQLELFRSIAGNYPVTLFYPLAQGHPDWSFAQDFYDRYLRGLAGADEVVDLLDGSAGADTSASARAPGSAPAPEPVPPPPRDHQLRGSPGRSPHRGQEPAPAGGGRRDQAPTRRGGGAHPGSLPAVDSGDLSPSTASRSTPRPRSPCAASIASGPC